MIKEKRKVVLVGCGMVGMSYAYSMLNQATCDELILIDVNDERAIGESMDLNHGLAFSNSSMTIRAGDYSDCEDADIVTICAGIPRKPGESRNDLLKKNREVLKQIIEPIMESGFNGIFLVASNPVDILTKVTCELSGMNPRRVIGSGTTLDTARLRYMLGELLTCDPRSIHAYIIGEHGDTEFVPWSQANLGAKSILELVDESEGKISFSDLTHIEEEVRTAGKRIIEAKKATYYGIGMSLNRITKAILGNENTVLTVSAQVRGEYDEKDIFVGVPALVNANGIQKILKFNLTDEELAKFHKSANRIRESIAEIE